MEIEENGTQGQVFADVPEINFFGESNKTSTMVEPKKEEPKKGPAKSGTNVDIEYKVKEEEELPEDAKDINFFGETKDGIHTPKGDDADDDDLEDEEDDDDDLEGDQKKKPAEKTSKEVNHMNTLSFLKDKGLVEYELEEGEEMDETLAEEILEESFEDRVESRVSELFEELPPVVKNFNKFVINGGDPKQFLSNYSQQGAAKGLRLGMDLSDEKNQEAIVRASMNADGHDPEYIDSQVQFLKDSKNLAKISKKSYKVWEKEEKHREKALLEEQVAARQADKERRKEVRSNVSKIIGEQEDFNGMKLTRDDKRSLPGYMTGLTVKLENGGVVTPMQRDLNKILNDEKQAILLATLVKSGLNFEELKKQLNTQVTNNIKDDVRRNKKASSPKKSSQGKRKKIRLADHF